MDMLDMLRRSGGLDAMAGQLGITPAEAAAGAGALLPAVVGGFKKRSQADRPGEAGIGGLIGMLGGLGGGALADNVVDPEPTDVGRGNEVLGQIFGSKEVSRTVAGHASQQSGLDPALLRRMLPILAMLVGGFLSSRGGGGAAGAPAQGGSGTGGGIFGNILGSVLGGGAGAQGGGGLGGIGAMLDLDGDGNPLDDIVGMAGRLGR
jgi:hypothetical protein